MLRIGVDVGGTFTDFAAWRDGSPELASTKASSTPPNFIEGFRAGLEVLLERLAPADGEPVVVMHGTTVSTNTVIERSGADLALFVTRGFRDILDLQRFRLSEPIRLDASRTVPLVPRHRVFEIGERVEPDGAVLHALDPDEVAAAAAEAVRRGASGISVAFLHGYRFPAHERAARDAIAAAFPSLDVSLSSEILPRIGEYERAVAAILNGYVKARMQSYLVEVQRYLAERLPQARLFITRSNGGAMAAGDAGRQPIHTLLSGPASGVTAARALGQDHGAGRCLTFDMGGTSTDMALLLDGQPTVVNDALVGDFPLTMPVTGIEAVGAGGGSVVWLDGEVLRVGPRSAGARPGPASFGRGGTEPTVTDAYLICGLIDPDNFLGGRMRLDLAAARAAFAPLAGRLGLSVEVVAEAATVATSNMVAKALPYLARNGVDPEELTLILYGGAGPLHGPLLAEELGVGRILVPRTPSVFCAFGGLVSELVHDTVATVYGQHVDGPALARGFADLAGRGEAWLAAQADRRELVATRREHWAEMRYVGQFFSINVPVPAEAAEGGDLPAVQDAFHAEHERLYSHADRGAAIELLELRLRIAGALPTPPPGAASRASEQAAPEGARTLRLGERVHEKAAVYARSTLAAGARIAGPAVIDQDDTSILVAPGFVAETLPSGDILMTRAA